MFNKKDPLIDSVKKVMEENQVRRDAEKALNEQLGIQTKRQLPFQKHAEYDAMLAEAIQEALKGAQHKIDANKNNKIDAHDFKLLRAKKEKKPEEHGVEAEREMASKGQKMYEEEKEESKEHEKKEKIDEASYSAKAARAGKDIGKPGKMFSKIAASAAKRYSSEERGKKVAGAVLAKLRSKKMEENVEQIEEKAPAGAKFERMVKHIKAGYAKDGGLSKKEKSIAYATAWKAKKKELSEGPMGDYNPGEEDSTPTSTKPATKVSPGQIGITAPSAPSPTASYGGSQMGGTPAAVKTQTTQAVGKPLEINKLPDTGQGAAQTAARMKAISNPTDKASSGASTAPVTQPKRPVTPTPSTASEPKSFGQAFAAARKAAGGGEGKFTYKGKEYQTNVAGEKYKPVSKLNPATPATVKE